MRTVLDIFRELSAIPRPTFHEEQIAKYLLTYGRQIGCKGCCDEKGNVILEKNPVGAKPEECVILQAHMDMVCKSDNGYLYEPERDPIQVTVEDGYLMAKNSTLGADDGIGIAVILKLLEDAKVSYPLRAIFTVEEECGMGGAKALSPQYLAGKYFVGLDWVSSKSTCVGCAGSAILIAEKHAEYVQLRGNIGVEIVVTGLAGGHSGMRIHCSGNAIYACATVLHLLEQEGIPFCLTDFEGGIAGNVIPDTCRCTLALPEKMYKKLQEVLSDPQLMSCLKLSEEDFLHAALQFDRVPCPKTGWSKKDTLALISFLRTVPNGILDVEKTEKSFLTTQSSNIGKISLKHKGKIQIMARANAESNLTILCDKIEEVGQQCGMKVVMVSRDPCFQSNIHEELLTRARAIYRRQNGKELKIDKIHAGMECGYFQQKNRKLQMIVLGAELIDIHTTKERMELGSEETVYQLLYELLQEFESGKEA